MVHEDYDREDRIEMIEILFRKNGFEVSGHSGFDVKGCDIVCSAVSVLTQHTARILERRCRASVTREEGSLKVSLKKIDDLSRILIEELYISLKDLEKQYPGNLKVEVIENGS